MLVTSDTNLNHIIKCLRNDGAFDLIINPVDFIYLHKSIDAALQKRQNILTLRKNNDIFI